MTALRFQTGGETLNIPRLHSGDDDDDDSDEDKDHDGSCGCGG